MKGGAMAPRVLVVENDPEYFPLLQKFLRANGVKSRLAQSSKEAESCWDGNIAAAVVDLGIPEEAEVPVDPEDTRYGKGVVKYLVDLGVEVFVLSQFTDYGNRDCLDLIEDVRSLLPSAVFFKKDIDLDQRNPVGTTAQFLEGIHRALGSTVSLPQVPGVSHPKWEMVGDSRAMKDVCEAVKTVAKTASTVLILGESGTGKELVAHAIHHNSGRCNRPFVIVNCGAIPETLLESELFGHVKGAFTDATANRIGRFEQADRGTIFLDEIGEMSPDLQKKLLRVLQEREFSPVGTNKTVKVDVRVIAATHVELGRAMQERRFREDLFYRLNVVRICLPPLRERTQDISPLAEHFRRKYCENYKQTVAPLAPEVLQLLVNRAWRGNVRELENLIQRIVVLNTTGAVTSEELNRRFDDSSTGDHGRSGSESDEGLPRETDIDALESRARRKELVFFRGDMLESLHLEPREIQQVVGAQYRRFAGAKRGTHKSVAATFHTTDSVMRQWFEANGTPKSDKWRSGSSKR